VLIESRDAIVYLNPAFARMLDYRSATDLCSGTIREIADPDDLERLQWYGRCRLQGKPAPLRYRFHARTRAGCRILFDASISVTRACGEKLITTFVRELACAAPATDFLVPGLDRLSERELEVIRHLLKGKRSKEIALLLDVSEKTVGTHRHRAFRKLALRSDLDLFRFAVEHDLL
jgi:PAS domain S-box-containing protein